MVSLPRYGRLQFRSFVKYWGWIIPICLAIGITVISSEAYIVNFVTDDALYYPTIARSIAFGNGSSYDGITQTNGYHPLWAWLQIPIAFLVGQSQSMVYLWFIKLFIIITVLVTLYVWQRLLSRVTGSFGLTAVVILLLGGYWWSFYTLYSGMETPLVILLMGLDLSVAFKLIYEGKAANISYPLLGILAALTFLSRLDSVFFLGVLLTFVLYKFRKDVKKILGVVVPMILIPLPYLWWNLSRFGNIVPVSGLKKTTLDINIGTQLSLFLGFWVDKVGKLERLVQPMGLVILCLLALICIYLARRELVILFKRLGILWTVPIGATLHYSYTSILMQEGQINWYQYSEYLSVYFFLAAIIAALSEWLRKRTFWGVIAIIPFCAIFAGVLAILIIKIPQRWSDQFNIQGFHAAVWARENLNSSPEPKFAMDDSGIFRFVSGFKTISLNGLAGDQDILRLSQQKNWAEISKRYKIDYIVDFTPMPELQNVPERYIVYRSSPYNWYALGRLLIVRSEYWTTQ